jgi:hypothetical protein
MKCPCCGLEKEVTARDLLLALMVDCGAKTNADFRRCVCKDGVPLPTYWKANDITEHEAEEMGELEHLTWRIHNAPDMGDCRYFNYGYHITNENRIICNTSEGEYYDITDDVLNYRFKEAK